MSVAFRSSSFFYLMIAALLFVYLAIPAIIVIKPAPRYLGLSWGVSILLMTLFILSVDGKKQKNRVAVLLLVTAFAIMNVTLTASFIMQGTPFNAAFLSHLDLSTLRIALKTDALRLGGAALYILAAPVIVFFMIHQESLAAKRVRKTPSYIRAVIFILSIALNYPLQSIALHFYTTSQSSERLLSEIDDLNLRKLPLGISVKSPKNLILIYLEGLEQNYHDPAIFPGLMPVLTKKRNEALWFSNVHQFPGTGWTVGGIVSSQCGVPLLSEGRGNRILTAVDNPFRQITCLAEYLKEAGYRTAFLGGASLDFAGKGNFLRDNGYDTTLGIDELPNSAGHSWGMYDVDMFNNAKTLVDGLSENEGPFFLTLLSLDTHHPSGTPSPGCLPYTGSTKAMLNAVHCADQLVQDFLSHLQRNGIAQNTVVALVSDHLLIQGDVEDMLEAKNRRITFMVLDPNRQALQMDGPATHFDIGPTLLELVGVNNADFAFGHSLLSNESGKAFSKNLTESDFNLFKVENLATRATLQKGIIFSPANNSILIGEARFQTYDGHEHSRAKTNLIGQQKDQFLAMYFSSMDDNYPELYWSADSLISALENRKTGLVVAASEGTDLCLGGNTCEGKRFLVLYDLASKKRVADKDGVELSLSAMDIKVISRSQ